MVFPLKTQYLYVKIDLKRNFLKKSIKRRSKMKLGAQFYSIRDNTKTPDDLKRSFAAMKKIGYEMAQMSAICPIDPVLLRSYSEEYELPITCTHSSPDRIFNDTDALIREHIIYKCPVIGMGSMPDKYRGSLEGLKAFLCDISEPAKRIEAAGLKFAYHNHAFEFKLDGDKPYYDIMIEQAPSLNFILDTYWIKYAGYDHLSYIRRLGGTRMTNIHFKDMDTEPRGNICPCGTGIIDFSEVKSLCEELGVPYALVEQDNAPDSGNSWGEMEISYNNLKELFR